MKLYHRTSPTAAVAILEFGFRDDEGTWGIDRVVRGVWFSIDAPVGPDQTRGDGAVMEVVIEFGEDEIREYEWVEDGKAIREMLLPAVLVNTRGTVRLLNSEGESALAEASESVQRIWEV